MIQVNAVTKRFGSTTAVRDVTLNVATGEALALWGSNGAGKTTLIRCMLGILRFRGDVRINGVSVKKRGKLARHQVGYVPQELAFHDDMRLGYAILFFASLRGVPATRCAPLLERLGLRGHERKRVRDLSGGMKQRLALAVAMLAEPSIIILDEPTSNLDASGRAEVMETLGTLKAEGKTILFASHKPNEVMVLADRVIVMEHGSVVRDTSPQELWPTANPVGTMRLHLRGGNEDEAARLLREAGHTVHLNGSGLCVAVPRESKALPIQVLTRASVEVYDFEMIEDVHVEREGSS